MERFELRKYVKKLCETGLEDLGFILDLSSNQNFHLSLLRVGVCQHSEAFVTTFYVTMFLGRGVSQRNDQCHFLCSFFEVFP